MGQTRSDCVYLDVEGHVGLWWCSACFKESDRLYRVKRVSRKRKKLRYNKLLCEACLQVAQHDSHLTSAYSDRSLQGRQRRVTKPKPLNSTLDDDLLSSP